MRIDFDSAKQPVFVWSGQNSEVTYPIPSHLISSHLAAGRSRVQGSRGAPPPGCVAGHLGGPAPAHSVTFFAQGRASPPSRGRCCRRVASGRAVRSCTGRWHECHTWRAPRRGGCGWQGTPAGAGRARRHSAQRGAAGSVRGGGGQRRGCCRQPTPWTPDAAGRRPAASRRCGHRGQARSAGGQLRRGAVRRAWVPGRPSLRESRHRAGRAS